MMEFPQIVKAALDSMVFGVIFVGLTQSAIQIVQLYLAARALVRTPPELKVDALWRRYAESAPAVSVLAPAFNEAATIAASVGALLTLQYPSYEVVIINDGSSDETIDVLKQTFGLQLVQRQLRERIATAPVKALYASAIHPRLLVIDKANGGKADALNAGINAASAPLFCAVDADSLLAPDALIHAVAPFLERPDEVVAVGGTVRVANGCEVDRGAVVRARAPRDYLALMQSVEYVRAFLLARLGMASIGAMTIISGAFGVFRTKAVSEIGGYERGTVGEDMELVVRLHRHFKRRRRRYAIVFSPHPVCWTEAPESLAVLARQRRRWQRGALEVFQRHAGMMLNPRYGRVGFVGLGMVFITDVAGPVAELAGYALIPVAMLAGSLSLSFLFAYGALNISLGLAITVAALGLEDADLRRAGRTQDLARLLGGAVLENLGYRQLNAVWRLQGLWDWARGRGDWGQMRRKGFRAPPGEHSSSSTVGKQ